MIKQILSNKPRIISLTDSRPLFESGGSRKAVNDKRLRVEISALREMIQNGEIPLRWIEGKQQIANALTKQSASFS